MYKEPEVTPDSPHAHVPAATVDGGEQRDVGDIQLGPFGSTRAARTLQSAVGTSSTRFAAGAGSLRSRNSETVGAVGVDHEANYDGSLGPLSARGSAMPESILSSRQSLDTAPTHFGHVVYE